MSIRKVLFLLALLICICLVAAFFFKDFFRTKTADNAGITNLEASYNADAEIAQAIARLNTSQEKATVISHGASDKRTVAITFDGLADRAVIEQILDLLRKYNAKATFFVDGMQTAEDPQAVFNIKKEGHKVENYTLSGRGKMENLPVERLVKDFCRAQKIIKVTTDNGPNLLKCNNTVYTDQLLRVAKACGFSGVVKNDIFFDAKQGNSPNAADGFVGGIRPGSVISIKLKTNTDPIEKEPGKIDLRPAVDKKPGLKKLPPLDDTSEKEIVIAVDRLLLALRKANYDTVYVEDFSQPNLVQKLINTTLRTVNADNFYSLLDYTVSFLKERFTALFTFQTAFAAEKEDNIAKEIKVISTTEQALSFTFGGLSNETAVNDVLDRLNRLGIKATFFVMEVEMKKYPETVRKIINNGHEIGIGIRPKSGESYDETYQSIIRIRKMLHDRFGVTTDLVKQPWGEITDTTRQAVYAANCKLIGHSFNVVQNKHKDYTSADKIFPEIFGKYVISLARGQIIHFRMDFYANCRLTGELVEMVKQRKVDNIAYSTSFDNPSSNPDNNSQYSIKPVGEILNGSQVYQYPVNPNAVPVHLRSDWRELSIDKSNFMSEVYKRYIGNEFVNDEDRMIGFSKMETRRLDKSGVINTEDKVIFLTFDDWGSDSAINKLLYVLRKHNVAGTFFVVTNNLMYNPNLLRAIALEGHEIASHSDQHKPMAVRDEKTGRQAGTQTKEEYIKDLETSYLKLQNIAGDVVVNGRPALTRYFRPPTLAVSKMGFEAVFKSGYEFIICGSGSTYDYENQTVTRLVRILKNVVYTGKGELRKGTILVMHMGDFSVYTATALDILLTANEAKDDSDPTKFKVGLFSDYLFDGYSQINRKETLRFTKKEEEFEE